MRKKNIQRTLGRYLPVAVVFFLGVNIASAQVAQSDSAVFARVGERVIAQAEYDSALKLRLRQKFFHGNISPQDLKDVSQEVGWTLVDRVLLLQEAARRGIQGDKSGPTETQADLTLAEESQLTALEAQVRKMSAPEKEEVLQFYTAFPEKFTLPEQLDLSLVLLKVPPYAKPLEWQSAFDKAVTLVAQLRKGEDFSELAKQHSQHESAKEGGSLGLLHQGMLADDVQKQLETLSVGQISEPIRLLQGIAIFRLNKRMAQTLIPFDKAQVRAASLLAREKEAQVWQQFIQELRQKTPISIQWPAL